MPGQGWSGSFSFPAARVQNGCKSGEGKLGVVLPKRAGLGAAVIRSALVTSVSALVFAGCAQTPLQDELITYQAASVVKTEGADCAVAWPGVTKRGDLTGALDASGFSLVSWNIHKAEDNRWPTEFAALTENQDLVLVQEAHLTPSFRGALEQTRLEWAMARAFDMGNAEVGVLTASKSAADKACLLRHPEPWINLPKSTLVTEHSLDGSHENLLLANLHGVNFTLGTVEFAQQLESVAAVLADHDGPLILAGDFNDWNAERTRILETITGRLGMKPLELKDDVRSRHLGRPVDHVFYRNLDLLHATSLEAASSEHNALQVRFRVPGDPRLAAGI